MCIWLKIRNADEYGFKWCLTYDYYDAENGDCVSSLSKINDKSNSTGMTVPAAYYNIAHVEDLNKVCIFTYDIDETGHII